MGCLRLSYSENDYCVVDYFSGVYPERSRRSKVLREFTDGEDERYLTTNHERDAETSVRGKEPSAGLDYRGARFYDSDVARFLSLDPLAMDYASWSDYNYVLVNPIIIIAPDGRGGKKLCPNQSAGVEGGGIIQEGQQQSRGEKIM